MYDKSTFVNQLRALREKSGLSQKDISVKLDTTEATVSRYFSGDRTPNIETAVELASILNVSMDTLCGIEPPAVDKMPQDVRILVSCYNKASADDKNVIWSLLNRYMTASQKAAVELTRAKQQEAAM